ALTRRAAFGFEASSTVPHAPSRKVRSGSKAAAVSRRVLGSGRLDRSFFCFQVSRIVYRDIPEELRSLIEPIVQDFGFELVDVALHRGRSPWQLRITLDTPQGDGRVSVERCAEVSREIGTQLDAADWAPCAYRLEVSSPGLDRVL